MTFAQLLRDRVTLERRQRKLSAAGDETETFETSAEDVPCLFDFWESRRETAPGRLDAFRRARLFLAPDAPETRPGDRARIDEVVWRIVQVRTVEGAAATLRVLEMEAPSTL